jgi:putative sigma-54 modulation protein
MRIEVRGRHLEITPAIREYAETKCQRLTKFFDGVQQITVTIERSTKHEEFTVEVLADVVKHEDFVARLSTKDVYEGIDLTTDKIARQLTDFKERLKGAKH